MKFKKKFRILISRGFNLTLEEELTKTFSNNA